jgi:cold shock CspA family protein
VARPSSRTGTVQSFEPHSGLGEVCDHDGTVHPFHCVSIADGSRDIAVGAEVTYRVEPGRRGRWEAVELTPR